MGLGEKTVTVALIAGAMQYGNGLDACLVFLAKSRTSGHCNFVLEAVIMASTAVQPRGKVRGSKA